MQELWRINAERRVALRSLRSGDKRNFHAYNRSTITPAKVRSTAGWAQITPKEIMKRCGLFVASLGVLFASPSGIGQTTAGTSSTIVVPIIAQTSSFGSEVTVYNPNGGAITVNAVFYDAQNTATPGPKACTSVSLGANVSKVFTLAAQCALPAGSNFGLLVLTESTGTNRFYGYARTQTPQGVGFSTEGFPIENFNDQLQHATGLKRVAASGGLPANQTNCFVATLADAVSYELRLYDGTTNVQLGSTLTGMLAPFQQYRYLDVFQMAGGTAAVGDKTNVRAQFTNLTGANKKLIGFCTVQENTTFSADFRIAKSYGVPGTVTSITQGNGITLTPNPISGAGTIAADTTYLQRRVSSTCAAGSSIRAIGADGTVTCQTDGNSGGTVTSVATGTGLSGGPITGSGTIAADTTYLQRRVSFSCAAGSSIRAIAADGTVTCQTDNVGPANGFVQGGNAFGTTALLGTTDNQQLTLLASNQPILRLYAASDATHISAMNLNNGSPLNTVDAGVVGGTISGGGGTFVDNGSPTPAANHLGTHPFGSGFETIGGGGANTASAEGATVSGGYYNTASEQYSTVGGGTINTASGFSGAVLGGNANTASGGFATVTGGYAGLAGGDYSTVVGGNFNTAAGEGSVAMGEHAQANYDGCLVFGDKSTSNDVRCDAPNRVVMRGVGGIYMFTGGNTQVSYTGVALAPGGGAWVTVSDRAAKENWVSIDPAEILAKVVALPISTWNWKTQDPAIRHIGPMGQDFRAAFGLGETEKGISTVDADGVALAAIQGLHQLVQEKDAKIEAQQRAIDAIRSELDAMKHAIAGLSDSSGPTAMRAAQ